MMDEKTLIRTAKAMAAWARKNGKISIENGEKLVEFAEQIEELIKPCKTQSNKPETTDI